MTLIEKKKNNKLIRDKQYDSVNCLFPLILFYFYTYNVEKCRTNKYRIIITLMN